MHCRSVGTRTPRFFAARFSRTRDVSLCAIMGVAARMPVSGAARPIFSSNEQKGDLGMDVKDDVTPDEQAIEATADVSGEEAHRVGEFDDLRDRLEQIAGKLDVIAAALEEIRTTAKAVDIDNGADVTDEDIDEDIAEDADVVVIPDYEDLDLDI